MPAFNAPFKRPKDRVLQPDEIQLVIEVINGSLERIRQAMDKLDSHARALDDELPIPVLHDWTRFRLCAEMFTYTAKTYLLGEGPSIPEGTRRRWGVAGATYVKADGKD